MNREYLNTLKIGLPSPFPGGTSGREPACQCRRCRRHGFSPWVGKIPWSRKWQPIPVFLPGEFHGQRCLVGYSPWACKESDMVAWLTLSKLLFFFNIFLNFILFNFKILYWFCHISKWICHRYTCVPHPEPSSLLPPQLVHWDFKHF